MGENMALDSLTGLTNVAPSWVTPWSLKSEHDSLRSILLGTGQRAWGTICKGTRSPLLWECPRGSRECSWVSGISGSLPQVTLTLHPYDKPPELTWGLSEAWHPNSSQNAFLVLSQIEKQRKDRGNKDLSEARVRPYSETPFWWSRV